MIIHVYGKPGCVKCEAAKEKLRKMGLAYTEHDLAYHTAIHEGWREDGSVEAMAAHTQMDTLPLISIGDTFYDYPSAMRRLKEMGYKACAGESA